jgi:hypothetical protein
LALLPRLRLELTQCVETLTRLLEAPGGLVADLLAPRGRRALERLRDEGDQGHDGEQQQTSHRRPR